MPRLGGSGRRILVTGGAGFIGSHLVDRLLADGDAVICADNLTTGAAANIAHLQGHPRFAFLRHDVTEPLALDVDAIFNLACPASPVHYQRDPVGTTRTAVLGALNMLDLARRLGCPILQASTSEVYGDPAMHPQTEEYWGHVNPIGPRACHDEGKRCAEALCLDHHRQHGVRVKVARIFNTYGARMHPDDGRVVPGFIMRALRGQDLTVHGDGSQTRSFCHVDDLVEGLVRLMATPDTVTGPVNLGNPDVVTIRALAETVLARTGSAARVVTAPLPPDDPRRRRPDIALARRLLGWNPAIGLGEGLDLTIAHFRARLRATDG